MEVSVATPLNIRRKACVCRWSVAALNIIAALLLLLQIANISKATCYCFSASQVNVSMLRHQRRYSRRQPLSLGVLFFSSPRSSSENDDPSDMNYMDDLSNRVETIHVEKLRDQLEKANTQSFLKHAPWKLPYNDARLWIQANLGPSTKEEFYDLVENGNLRTPYIPKRPEEYYTRTREWISWDHFLTGLLDQQHPSAIKPSTGFFD